MPTRATELADVVPIGVFMLVYLGLALNRFLGIPPASTTFLVIGFAAIVAITMQVRCGEGFIGFPGADAAGVKPCLNGSLSYLPALAALIVVGLVLSERGHRAAPWLLWAAAIFAVSITLRSLDLALCDKVVIEGRKTGTHAAWHVLNALALFLLLRASLEGGPDSVARAEPHAETPVEFLRPEEVPAQRRGGGAGGARAFARSGGKGRTARARACGRGRAEADILSCRRQCERRRTGSRVEPEAADEESKPKTFFPA